MAKFITRVELHNAVDGDYTALHLAMQQEKFSRHIIGDDRVIYHLPSATYYSFGQITCITVQELAARAASKTKKSFWILVCDYTVAAWMLQRA